MAEFIAMLIAQLARLFIPMLAEASKDKAEQGSDTPELRRAVTAEAVKSGWTAEAMAKTAPVLIVAVCLLMLCGCMGDRIVYVPDGAVVRLAEDIEDVEVWAIDASGEPVKAKMTLKNGWFVAPKLDVDMLAKLWKGRGG